jgi:hypothetical protein
MFTTVTQEDTIMKIMSCLWISALCAAPLFAANILVDDFEGMTLGNVEGQNGWIVDNEQAANRSATVVSGGLSYTADGWNISGGDNALLVDISANGSGDPAADLVGKSFSPVSGSSVYFRYVVNTTSHIPSFVSTGFSGAAVTDTAGSGDLTAQWSRTSATGIVTRGGSSGADQLRGYDSGGANSNTDISEIANGTFLVAGKIVFNGGGNEDIFLSINPLADNDGVTPGFQEPGSWDATLSRELGVSSLGYFGLFANNLENDSLTFDNIAVADSWEDVVTVIPEPSTFMLMGLSLAVFLLKFRRR